MPKLTLRRCGLRSGPAGALKTRGDSARMAGWSLLASTLVVACVTAIGGGPARAASFSLNLTTDPSLGTIANVVDANSNPGQRWTSVSIAFDPIMLDQGDSVSLSIVFSDALSVVMQSGAFSSGNENIAFRFLPLAPATSLVGILDLNSFTNPTGDLDATLPISGGFSTSNQITGSITRDLTDTAFGFEGVQMDATYTTLTGGPVTVSSIELSAQAAGIVVVPEPSTALLLTLGLVGLVMRRTRPVP